MNCTRQLMEMKKYSRTILIGLFVVTSLLLVALTTMVTWTYFKSVVSNSDIENAPLVKAQEEYLKAQTVVNSVEKNMQDPVFVDSKSSELNFGELTSTNMVNSELMHGNGCCDKEELNTGEVMSTGEYRDDNFDEETNENNQLRNIPKIQTVKNKIETKEGEDADMLSMTLYKVEKGVREGAVCLDGSSPAYYHRPGFGPNDRSWILHFNGGAWCFDRKACIERSRSSLGSTKKLPKSPPIIQGINSPNPQMNPDFYDWNLVWIVYCDGASFTGNLERPIISKDGDTIYMRGKRVIDAIIDDLILRLNFKSAESIVLTGSSAGSMAAIFQADYIAARLPKNVPVKVLADAGYFVDTQPIGGKSLTNMFQKVFEMQNSSSGLNQECIRRFSREPWKCFLPAVATHFVKTPIYYLNSAYDIWSLIYFLGIDCKFPTIDEQRRRKRDLSNRKFPRKINPIGYAKNNDSLIKHLIQKRDISGFEMQPFFRDEVKHLAKTVSKVIVSSGKSKILRNATLDGRRSEIKNVTALNNTTIDPTKNKTTGTREKQETSNEDRTLRDNSTLLENNSVVIITTNTSDSKEVSKFYYKKPHTTENPELFKKNKISKPNNKLSFDKLKTLESLLPMEMLYDQKNNQLLQNIHAQLQNAHSIHSFKTSKIDKHLQKTRTKSIKEISHAKSKKKNLPHKMDNLNSSNSYTSYFPKIITKGKETPKRHSLKRRRSASIAREYINILRSDPPECTEKEINDALKYRNLILRDMDQSMVPKSSGRFLVSCIDHSMSLFDETWTGMKIDGISIQQAFGDWFFNRVPTEKSNLIDCPYPCNDSCP